MKYEVISLDVWGNTKDGFDVNEEFHTGNFIDITGNTRKSILTQCRKQGVITTITPFDVDCSSENFIFVQYKNGKPAFNLEKECLQ